MARWIWIGALLLAGGTGMKPTGLAVRETRFTLDGRPVFLLGISYYGALGASKENLRRDLDRMQGQGFNWLRLWANWGAFGNDVSVVDAEGRPREPFLSRLKELVAECDRRGMVVDVTLSRGNGVAGPPRLQTLAAHRRAVEALVSALKPHRNWYLDLGNERNLRDARLVPFGELRELRATARRLDPELLVTASLAGDISREELRRYLTEVEVDLVTPHRPRSAESPRQTEVKTREYLAWMRELGRVVPVHYQEPFRRGFGSWEPRAEDFLVDLRGALAGGAAGWCFHNGDQRRVPDGRPRRAFDLREGPLFEQLDAEERKAVAGLRATAGIDAETYPGVTWEIRAPEDVGLARAPLEALRELVGGRGCVVRGGAMAYRWGDQAKSSDVASAVKPLISLLLLIAAQEGRLKSVDNRVADLEPGLKILNDGKDAAITWRHLASQTSGYGMVEPPGAAYSYNDFALALYYDTLMSRVFESPGTEVLKSRLAGPLGFQDGYTFEAFGARGTRSRVRPGRLEVSVRDFARFGLLVLCGGRWRDRQILRPDLLKIALSSPVPAETPLTSGKEAAMLPGQRSLGGGKNITPVGPGYYSFNWWLNGKDRQGRRLLVDAPADTILASGHGGKRALWIIPSLDLVVSWNDTTVDDHDASPGNPETKMNRAAKLLVAAVTRAARGAAQEIREL